MTKFVEWAALIVAIGLIIAIIVTLPIMDIITQTIGSDYLTTKVLSRCIAPVTPPIIPAPVAPYTPYLTAPDVI